MTKIVWREWYSDQAVAALTEMGTLPREEMNIDCRYLDGVDVAAFIAEACNKNDFEAFAKGGKIVILEPKPFAGTYDITVDYEPSFIANRAA